MARHVIDDSPAGLAVLLSRKHGSGDDMAPAHGGGDALPAGCEDAAQDVIDNLHDAKGLANALHDFWSLCQGSDDTDEGPTDEE